MPTPAQLLSRAVKITQEEGLSELYSSASWFVRNRGLNPRYWQGQLKHELELECSGVSVNFDTSTPIAKDFFYPRYIDGKLHEPALTRRLIQVLESDSVYYDIGANVGYFTVFASKVCSEGEVHAFELDEKFVESMKRSLSRNDLNANIVEKAVSDTSDDKVGYTDD